MRAPKHIHTVKSGGKIYYRHRLTGERLPDDEQSRYLKAWEINNRLENAPKFSDLGHTVGAVIRSWQKTPKFRKLAPLTQKDYRQTSDYIDRVIGDEDVATVTEADIVFFRNELAETPRKADKLVGVMNLLLRHAEKDLKWVGANVARDVEKFNESVPYPAWPEHVLHDVLAVAPERLALAITGVYLLGPRIHEFVKLPWPREGEGRIEYQPGKRGKMVSIPITDERAALLERVPRVSPIIFTTRDDKPWTANNLRHSITRWVEMAGHGPKRESVTEEEALAGKKGRALELGYSAHGLRHSRGAVLAESGASIHEIMSWFGHKSPQMAMHYTSTANRAAMADSAAEKMDGHQTNKVVRIKR